MHDYQVGTFYPNLSEREVKVVRESKKPALMVLHWKACGHCVRLMPTLHQLAQTFKTKNKKVMVLGIESENIPESWNVRGFPTIWLFMPDGSSREYRGDRTMEALYEAFN
jgi:thiol-disulfide isomerase/thioredoxin